MPNIPVRVKNLIQKYDTTNPYSLAKYLKIEIIVTKLPSTVNGLWRRILRRKIIFINEQLPERFQKAVLCHELGHILMHPHYAYYCMAGRTFYATTKYENEANEFAVTLLSHSSDTEPEFILQFLQDGYHYPQQLTRQAIDRDIL